MERRKGGFYRPFGFMNENYRVLTIGKKEYKLVFTTQAYLEVIRRFGGLKELSEELDKPGADSISMYIWLIALLANQGIELDNEEKGEDMPLITEKNVMLHLSPIDFSAAKATMFSAISAGMKRETKNSEDDKNDEDEVLTEIKNVKGATEKKNG
jgi:hypothetical protein